MIRQITYLEALDFFLEHKAWKEKVTITEKGEWFAHFSEGNAIQGIVSTQTIGKWVRVKTLFVPKKNRRLGIARALVCHVSQGKSCTAFAFDASKPIFEFAGFYSEKLQKNGIHFMRKEVV